MFLHSDLASEYVVDVVKSHWTCGCARVCMFVCVLPVVWQSKGIAQLHDCTLPLKKKKKKNLFPVELKTAQSPSHQTQYFSCIHTAISGQKNESQSKETALILFFNFSEIPLNCHEQISKF